MDRASKLTCQQSVKVLEELHALGKQQEELGRAKAAREKTHGTVWGIVEVNLLSWENQRVSTVNVAQK